MEWCDLYPKDRQPIFIDFILYADKEAQSLWHSLNDKIMEPLSLTRKLYYSTCSGKPGWNMKLRFRSKTLATIYPETFGFTAFIVIPFNLYQNVLIQNLSAQMSEMYEKAQEYMKIGKWLMFEVRNETDFSDLSILINTKAITDYQPQKRSILCQI